MNQTDQTREYEEEEEEEEYVEKVSFNYPFKSKYKYLQDYFPFTPTITKEPYVPDYKLKIAKKLSKPDFSNEPGTWEADLMFVNTDSAKQIYLVMINVNTR